MLSDEYNDFNPFVLLKDVVISKYKYIEINS